MSEAFVIRAGVAVLELGILAGDLLKVERASVAELGDVVVVDAGVAWSVQRFVPGLVVKGRVLEVAGRRG